MEHLERNHRNRIRARDAEIEAFVARLERLLNRATTELARQVNNATDITELDGLKALNDFESVLTAAGLSGELERLRATYAEELKFIQEHFKQMGFPETEIFTGADREVVEVLIQNDFRKVGNEVARHISDINSVIARQVLTGTAAEIPAGLSSRAVRNINTELHTGVAAFSRTVTVKKAVDILGENPKFLYTGARIDGVIRDFCRGLLLDRSPAIYTLEEIRAMDSDPLVQIAPVLTYGGGYNCRHDWSPVTDEMAAELAPQDEFGSDEFR